MQEAKHTDETTPAVRHAFAATNFPAHTRQSIEGFSCDAPANWRCESTSQEEGAEVTTEISRCLDYYVAHEEDLTPSLADPRR